MSRPGIADLDDDDLEEGAGASDVPSQGSSPENVPAVLEPVKVAQGRPRPALTLADLPEPEETEAIGPLTAEEESLLQLCMRGIEQFENAWWVMGKSLANIKARRLYRKTHDSFEAFCWDNFRKSRATAYEEMTAYAVGELVSARADRSFEGNSNGVSARADRSFEGNSNGVSARADPAISKKAAAAVNTITQDYGADVSVAVVETIRDAAGKKVPVKVITGVVQKLPRKKEQELTQEELTARAHELATAQAQASLRNGEQERQADGAPGTAMASLHTALSQLKAAHLALAPAKVKQALEEAPEEAAELLADAEDTAVKAANRARQQLQPARKRGRPRS
ncbi:hypothetical protein [Streptantibioticus ferralitis]|uniref:Uncharacterized protein n=1 Tax=Streptantibioticus ferralitis TaxID=236510 RepID=A0ABT5ZAT1_9ACTN|nr:hypothetical protein [Streptantibioticus ferralitis]MDF2260929.1 hypothetical protein [Streptantibioticus ferralitis]